MDRTTSSNEFLNPGGIVMKGDIDGLMSEEKICFCETNKPSESELKGTRAHPCRQAYGCRLGEKYPVFGITQSRRMTRHGKTEEVLVRREMERSPK
jgi:hypothetical protein